MVKLGLKVLKVVKPERDAAWGLLTVRPGLTGGGGGGGGVPGGRGLEKTGVLTSESNDRPIMQPLKPLENTDMNSMANLALS